MLYPETESYLLIRSLLLPLKPHAIALKSRIEGDVLLLTNRKYELLFLNRTAKDFFQLCDGQRNVAEIIDILHNEYEVEKERLTDDIMKVIKDMQIKRLIVFDPLER